MLECYLEKGNFARSIFTIIFEFLYIHKTLIFPHKFLRVVSCFTALKITIVLQDSKNKPWNYWKLTIRPNQSPLVTPLLVLILQHFTQALANSSAILS